jgi:tripartite-type tricarboxylate transporter receptor subunit TctC
MRRVFGVFAVVLAVVSVAACAQAAFPEKGKAITVIMPWPPGGPNDIGARVLAPLMEKDLGVPVQIVNKPGAGSQVGITQLAQAKPDGYAIGVTALPTTIQIYVNPERQAAFGRKSLLAIATHTLDPLAVAVKASSPFKTLKELIDYAKANPGKLRAGTGGLLTITHFGIIQFEKATGAKFSIVHFEGGPQQMTALLGGHVDVNFDFPTQFMGNVKSGEMRALGVMDRSEHPYLPGVKTLEAQGHAIYSATARVWSAPAGTPREIVDALGNSIRKAMETDEHKKKIGDLGMLPRFMSADQTAKYWDETEAQIRPIMLDELAKQKKN